jgi:predicted murein hydrolase (TIGR00659 family)
MNPDWPAVYSTPIFGVAVTVIAYAIASGIQQRVRWMPALLLTCGGLVALLYYGRIPYASYKPGGDIVQFFLGPATIALGVPFYKHAKAMRAHAVAIVSAVAIGSASGIASAGGLVLLLHGPPWLLRSMIPKSVTTPISIELAKQLGGLPPLTAVFTVLAGLLGSIVGPQLLRLLGIRGNIAIGLAMGTSSHGIGTARIIRDSEFQGGASGLAMALAGIITSLLVIPLQHWLHQ